MKWENDENYEEKIYNENLYREIDRNFQSKKFDFLKMKNNEDYLEVLKKYISDNGYGYVYKELSKLKREDGIEILNLLVESNLIKKPRLEIEKIENEYIEYEYEYGIEKEIFVKFKNINFPFKINHIEYGNKNFVKVKILSNKEIKININIEEGKDVTFFEEIIIYTSIGIEQVKITIKCKKSKIMNINTFEEFIELIKKNSQKAEKIFGEENFKEWLKKKKYITQLLNIKDAKGDFSLFLKLNGIFLENKLAQDDKVELNGEVKLVEKEANIELEDKKQKDKYLNKVDEINDKGKIKESFSEVEIKKKKRNIEEDSNNIEKDKNGVFNKLKRSIRKIFGKN